VTRLGVLILVLMLTSMALVGGAMLYGRTHPKFNGLRVLGFNVCEGQPCYKGITPGRTSWDVASWIAKPVASKVYSGEIVLGDAVTSDWEVGIVQGQSAPDLVGGIGMYLRLANHFVYAGQIIDMYGVPCRVMASEPSKIWLLYPSMYAQVVDRNLSLISPVYDITLLNPLEDSSAIFGSCGLCGDPKSNNSWCNARWRGFANNYWKPPVEIIENPNH